MRFHATLEQHGKTATGIEVPAGVLAALGPGKRPAVRVTIKGFAYASTVGSMGGRSLFPVSASVREQAGISAGDDFDVDVEPDSTPREVTVPDDLASALRADTAAQRAFDALSYTGKHRLVLPIEQAKGAGTRERRLARALQALRSRHA